MLISCDNTPQRIESYKQGPGKIREQNFTIAILPEQNVFEQKKRYRPLAEYLSNTLNSNVKIKLLDSYGAVDNEIKNKTIDGAFFGSLNYVLEKEKNKLEPIARPVEPNGRSQYRGIIFTRKGSGLTENAASWKGKSIALVHEETTAGYIFPRWYLRRYGIWNFESHFRRIIFTGSHDAAILAVYKGHAALGAAKDIVYEKVLSENPAIRDDMVIVAKSIEVPSNSLCVRGDMKPAFREMLKKVLLSMHTTAEGKHALIALNAVRFTETTDSEFHALREMTREAGIDAKAYHLRDRR
jgi:phosphonate transport system substrate-binding protein